MKWIKRGLIFAPNDNFEWMRTHASVPVADRLNEEVLRIYFGTRDARGLSHIGYVDVEADNPANVIAVSEEPLLPLGNAGTFDDRGIMPSWIVRQGETKFFYYIGWNAQLSVPYHLSIGLAVSEGGKFAKYSEGPICDRSIDEPFFNTSPCVMIDGRRWRMWYISCTGWEFINGQAEPRYHVKYAESDDGIRWRKTGRVCIDSDDFASAIARPCVYRHAGKYVMSYSYRNVRDYRTNPEQSYRLGYAESEDGLVWTRRDEEVGISRSETGWDSQMMEYCSVFEHKGNRFLLYNGNGFGQSGFGYAIRED